MFVSSKISAQQVRNDLEIKHIRVCGQASVASVPDMFHFSVYLEEQGVLLSKLNDLVSEKSEQIVKLLLKKKIDKQDIQSMRVELRPWFEHQQSTRIQKGFVLSRQIKITMRNMEKYEQVIDGILRLGASRIDGFNYAVSDPESAYLKALEFAISDAKKRATTMAKTMGLQIGEVLSMQEGGNYNPMPHARESLMMTDSSGGYFPGKINTNAQVSVIFSLDNWTINNKQN